jgi:hypothetical protein
LEHTHLWYRINRAIGSWLPGLCVEIQVLARKTNRAVANAATRSTATATKLLAMTTELAPALEVLPVAV